MVTGGLTIFFCPYIEISLEHKLLLPRLQQIWLVYTLDLYIWRITMWEIRNNTRFASAATIVIDKTGEKHWVVVVKGTFNISKDSKTELAEEQIEPLFAPQYRGVPGESSLIYEQDLLPGKPRSDIYLNATAHAPNGRPVTKLIVGIQTAGVNKKLIVHGDRIWKRNPIGIASASTLKPFLKMPIVYERAYGGFDQQDPNPANHRLDPRNPVGTGLFKKKAHRAGNPLPNIAHYKQGKNIQWAAGFGALCSYWKPRLDYQGTYDDKWIKTRKPLLPDDYDPLTLQCAPPDQQVTPHLRGGEPISLLNLTSDGVLQFHLPKHYLVFSTHIGHKRLDHRAILNTVIIEPDYPRVVMVWHSTLSCHHDIDNIDYTRVTEKEYV
jgi:hypothetical protein